MEDSFDAEYAVCQLQYKTTQFPRTALMLNTPPISSRTRQRNTSQVRDTPPKISYLMMPFTHIFVLGLSRWQDYNRSP